MALISGTDTRYDKQGLREELENTIYNVSPEDTVFLSSIGRSPCVQTLVEWQTDSLRAAAVNAQLEGDDATFTTNAPTARVGNYTQISRDTIINSDTLEVVDKAGRNSEIAYELMKAGKALKLDKEFIMLRAQAGDAGGVGTARNLASLSAWLKTNVSFGSGGANPTYTAGVPSAVRTDGTLRPFTETILKDTLQTAWNNGGKPTVLMVGPVNKVRVSGFAGEVTRNFNQNNVDPSPTAIIASADVYVSDFGVIRVIPNRLQREQDGWLIDWSLLRERVLRPMKDVPLARTGDAEKRMLINEYTLQVKAESGLALCADLTTT